MFQVTQLVGADPRFHPRSVSLQSFVSFHYTLLQGEQIGRNKAEKKKRKGKKERKKAKERKRERRREGVRKGGRLLVMRQ